MRTHRRTVNQTYLSISRNIRYTEIEQKIGERYNHPFAETAGKLLGLCKRILVEGKVFNEEGC